MMIDVKVPSVGESITSGVLGSWRKKTGELVQDGDVLFEIETDKVTSEVYAPTGGMLQHLVPEGTTVQVGQIVGKIDSSAAPATNKQEPSQPAAQKQTLSASDEKTSAKSQKDVFSVKNSSSASTENLSPAVRQLVAEQNISPANIPGSGKGGRILKEDVLAHLEKTSAPNQGSGNASKENLSQRSTRRPMSPLRKRIADRLVSAQQTAAILTTFNEVDMSSVMALRAKFQDRFVTKHGIKLGFMSFFVKAVVHALKVVPNINAQIQGDEIIENHFYDLGVAIGTEKGLIVPVLRDVDTLSFASIEKSLVELAQRARAGKITLDDLQGGVFTISNGGTYGSLLSTPILNPPQSGILGMHTIQERPVALNGRVEIRPMMYLALSYDHRLVDGKEAVTFLIQVKEFIENPALALLEL